MVGSGRSRNPKRCQSAFHCNRVRSARDRARRTPSSGPGQTLASKSLIITQVQSMDRLARETKRFISIIAQSETGSQNICSMKMGRSESLVHLKSASHTAK